MGRTRIDYLNFLRDHEKAATDARLTAVLQQSVDEANAFERNLSPLASLARLVEACDAIESGEAAALARRLRSHEEKLRPGRHRVTSPAIDAYIRLRELQDQRKGVLETEWTGPREETIRRTPYLNRYFRARQEARDSKPKPSSTSKSRRIEEIIGGIPTPEGKQDMRFFIDEGLVAQKKLRILQKAIELHLPGLDIDELLSNPVPRVESKDKRECNGDDRQDLVRLRNKLQDSDALRHFGLTNDGSRVKTLHTGAHFIDKSEYAALMRILNSI